MDATSPMAAGNQRPHPGRFGDIRAGLLMRLGIVGMLVVGSAATFFVAHRLNEQSHEAARARFDRLTDRVITEAERRLQLPMDGLMGARGVYAASKSVDRLEFRKYVESRDLGREFPGALGFGFIERVRRSDLETFLAAERADSAPEFDVKITDTADTLYIVKFIEPLPPNRPAWGCDVGWEPVRRAAVERAIRTGQPSLTGPITLMHDQKNRLGLLYLVPVYRNGTDPKTDDERTQALQGLVVAPLAINEVYAGVAETAEGNLDFEVFQGPTTTDDTLIYDDDGHLAGAHGAIGHERYQGRMFEATSTREMGGRLWTIRTSTTPTFDAGVDTARPALVILGGLLLSSLAAGLIWTIGRSQARAVKLAVVMTADLRRATGELARTALTDRLTGLPNRTLLLDRLGQVMKRTIRNPERGYALLFLDFDRFKLINDTMGHEAGDRLLILIAQRLQDQLRTSDSIAVDVKGNTAARMGGDEFVVLLDDLARPEDAEAVAARLVEAFAVPYEIEGQRVISTASIGVVMGDSAYVEASEVLRDADLAMYEAKATGKGRYVVFDAAMRERVLRRVGLERDLAGGTDRGEFFLHYQPIVCVDTGRTESVEALLRWRHPSLGDISPGEFIPIAEETGQILELGEWVVREASSQVRRWRGSLGRERTPVVGVNISRLQLSQPDLAERLAAIMRPLGVEPGAICLEITETAVMRDPKGAIEQLGRLRAAGFRLALDDFGTGQSSLASLQTLPLDVVKIDRAFVAQSAQGRAHAAMVQAVVNLASNLGLEVVAEGVETLDQLSMLQALDCRYAQGYYFGRPAPGATIEAQLGACIAAA